MVKKKNDSNVKDERFPLSLQYFSAASDAECYVI